MAASIADDELYLLGITFYQDVIAVMMESVTWGMYAILFSFAMSILWRRWREHRSNGSLLMIVVTLYLFASSTVLWSLQVTWVLKKIKYALMFNSDGLSLSDLLDRGKEAISPLSAPMESLFLFNMIVGDAVVISRAKAIWGGSWRVIIVPLLLLATSTAFAITAIVCITANAFTFQSSDIAGNFVCTKAEPASWLFSLITNVLTTSIIAYRAWQHRRFLKSAFNGEDVRVGRSRVERILALLCESGFIYSLLLLSQLVDFWDLTRYDKGTFAFVVLAPIGDQISGLYPTVIIVLVSMERTYWDSTPVQSRPLNSGTRIQFASHPMRQLSGFKGRRSDDVRTSDTLTESKMEP